MITCFSRMNSRPPPRRASLDTCPPIDGGEERHEAIPAGA
ncbi:MAG: endonuclease domain-containing protein, partial [Mesorhizobium sp.]